MPSLPATSAEDVINQPARIQFEAFLDEHRDALNGCLDGLTEQKVWFDEAVTCRPRAEIGISATPDESFILSDDDTIATAQHCGHADILREQLTNE